MIGLQIENFHSIYFQTKLHLIHHVKVDAEPVIPTRDDLRFYVICIQSITQFNIWKHISWLFPFFNKFFNSLIFCFLSFHSSVGCNTFFSTQKVFEKRKKNLKAFVPWQQVKITSMLDIEDFNEQYVLLQKMMSYLKDKLREWTFFHSHDKHQQKKATKASAITKDKQAR